MSGTGVPTSTALLAQAATAAGSREDIDVADLLTRYYDDVPSADLVDHGPDALAATALAHLELAASRRADDVAVAVRGPGSGALSPTGAAVQVVSRDLPFLVDSLTTELTRQGCAITLVLHPVLPVRHGPDGRSVLLDPDGDPESWVHLELQVVPSEEQRTAIADRLRDVLADVRVAVDDDPAMTAAALDLALQLDADPRPEASPAAELLRWLAEDQGTLLGSATYRLPEAGSPDAEVVPGSPLGLLRRHGAGPDGPAGAVPSAASADAGGDRLLVVSKTPVRSTVQRPAYLDSVAVRLPGADGTGGVEHRFICLFAAAAYTESVQRVPVVRHKAQAVLRRSGFSPRSHSGRDLLQILETYPRDELFQAGVEDLWSVAHEVLHLRERRRLRLFLRRDQDASYLSCLVYLPRDRYSREVRQRMEAVLTEAFDAEGVENTVRVTESVLARVHFVVRPQRGRQLPDVDADALERRLADTTRSWDDDLSDTLRRLVGDQEADALLGRLGGVFPEAYKGDSAPDVGAADLVRIAGLVDDELSMSLDEEEDGELRFKVASCSEMSLSAVLPVLQDMAVEVVDARAYRLDEVRAHLYDFRLRRTGPDRFREPGVAEAFQDVFASAWSGAAETDGLNALVLRGGLHGADIVVLRAYAKYLRQCGWSFTPAYVEQCLTTHAGIARQLVELFTTQLDPEGDDADREQRAAGLAADVEAALAEVASLDQDRILRAFLQAIRATSRTNHFAPGADGNRKPWLSLKLAPATIPGLPEPRPEREIWVYSPSVEGVHLRFGAVARGGLRWSDRREDFRTEVLGLVKAQVVKNAVIVPVGAKGGFVAKSLPDPAAGRDAWQAAGLEAYRTFIRGLLDLTDDLVDGVIVPPPHVVRRDGDDAYLVVAADKGTATFSDTANEVAAEYGFWLGDAFASGGSVGYDHKAMGITARGAWESVRRHFRELDVDPGVDEITVVGIGDMSGDVFGNGMLLSRSLRLMAAFDHRHIFLDPDPDPAVSHAERQRLFALPRSSWLDYDPARLSEGGGVYPRSAKTVPVSPQVRARLELPEDCDELPPSALLSAVLRAPVDLLWNGGIGTWVKASTESSADAGDRANDAVRVDGRELRCRVVGEGGNLGLTQRGRVEAARNGVRLNTDAIDNSAGVACSDREVNLKILLDRLVADGALPRDERDTLLVDMTDEVAELVLRENLAQNVLLGNAREQARPMLPVHRRYLRQLEATGELDRELEALPADSELEERGQAGRGLTSPEFAVLTAYAKNTLKTQLLTSALPDEPWYARHLRAYFPSLLRDRFGSHLTEHPLRREIITTSVVNELVDQGGTSMVFRAVEETGATTDDVVRAYTVATEVFGLPEHWREIEGLRPPVPVRVQVSLHLEARRLVDRVVRRLLADGAHVSDVAAAVERYAPTVEALLPSVPELVSGAEHGVLHGGVARRVEQGVPIALARSSVSLLHAFPLLDVVHLASDADEPPAVVARLHYLLSAALDVDTQLGRISALPRADRWQALARSALRDDLYAALSRLTADVLSSTSPGDPADRIEHWQSEHAAAVATARSRLQEVETGDVFDLATMSVVVRTLRAVLPVHPAH